MSASPRVQRWEQVGREEVLRGRIALVVCPFYHLSTREPLRRDRQALL